MSKISVIKLNVDMEKLNNEILMYESEHNIAPYLFMNKDTFDCLFKIPVKLSIRGTVKQSNSCVSTYCDFKTFVSDDLKYGEIELR